MSDERPIGPANTEIRDGLITAEKIAGPARMSDSQSWLPDGAVTGLIKREPNLKDELVAIGAKALAPNWDATTQQLAELMRSLAAEGVGHLVVGTTTQEVEHALLDWARLQRLEAAPVDGAFGSRAVMLSWGYVPNIMFVSKSKLDILPDGSLRGVRLDKQASAGCG